MVKDLKFPNGYKFRNFKGNITDNSIAQRIWRLVNNQEINLPDDEMVSGFNYADEMAAGGIPVHPNYNKEYALMGQIAATIGAKISF